MPGENNAETRGGDSRQRSRHRQNEKMQIQPSTVTGKIFPGSSAVPENGF